MSIRSGKQCNVGLGIVLTFIVNTHRATSQTGQLYKFRILILADVTDNVCKVLFKAVSYHCKLKPDWKITDVLKIQAG